MQAGLFHFAIFVTLACALSRINHRISYHKLIYQKHVFDVIMHLHHQGASMEQNRSTLTQAKRDFENGYLQRYVVQRTPMASTWQIWLGNQAGWLVSQRDEAKPREFKTLDAAISALESIGFRITAISEE
jgi:hypothetical protein